MNEIKQFDADYAFLSNFYPCNIIWEGLMYHSVEAAFQAAKTLDPEERKRFTIMTPGDAKRAGRKVQLRLDWNNIRVNIMYQLCSQKFHQPRFTEKLLATGDATLIEGNTWHDTFWGVDQNGNGHGENNLGRILMQIRDELRTEQKIC